MRDTFRVSAKCAIFSPDGQKVLIAQYGNNEAGGLPGGHLEGSETPDEAMARELREELGVENIQMHQAGFFRHENGKIILGYTATLDPEYGLQIQEEELSGAAWIDVEDIRSGTISLGTYGPFVLEHQLNKMVK